MLCFEGIITALKRKKKEKSLCLGVKQRTIERVESFSDSQLNACDKHFLVHKRTYPYTQDFVTRIFSRQKGLCERGTLRLEQVVQRFPYIPWCR